MVTTQKQYSPLVVIFNVKDPSATFDRLIETEVATITNAKWTPTKDLILLMDSFDALRAKLSKTIEDYNAGLIDAPDGLVKITV